MKKKALLLMTFFLLSACIKSRTDAIKPSRVFEFDLKISSEWMYATKVSDLKYGGVIISRPPGFEQLILSLTIPERGGLSLSKHCVYYTVPYKEKISSFKIQVLKHDVACPEVSENGETFFSVEGMDQLMITFSGYKLKIEFEYQKAKKMIEIPLPNIDGGMVHEKYHPLKGKSLLPGMRFLRLTDESFDFASNKYLGKIADRFSLGSAIRCHQVNKACETVGENRCGECRYGWYEVVDFQCPQGGSKFCGQNHCGEKNEPACPRGVKVVEREEAGICLSELEPVMNAEKILVCQ